jgi:hypothetical protein
MTTLEDIGARLEDSGFTYLRARRDGSEKSSKNQFAGLVANSLSSNRTSTRTRSSEPPAAVSLRFS